MPDWIEWTTPTIVYLLSSLQLALALVAFFRAQRMRDENEAILERMVAALNEQQGEGGS